jgi:hypothetical protein
MIWVEKGKTMRLDCSDAKDESLRLVYYSCWLTGLETDHGIVVAMRQSAEGEKILVEFDFDRR